MSLDPDTQTLTQWLLAALGIGGGGYKIVTHETRIDRLEKDRQLDIVKLDKSINDIAGMKGTLDSVESTVDEIRNILLSRGQK